MVDGVYVSDFGCRFGWEASLLVDQSTGSDFITLCNPSILLHLVNLLLILILLILEWRPEVSFRAQRGRCGDYRRPQTLTDAALGIEGWVGRGELSWGWAGGCIVV